MVNKELKKLSRAELLELLLIQTKENEQLRMELEESRSQLESRRYRIDKAGNLAQAIVEINEIAQIVQKTADLYLENIKAMEAEAKERCEQMLSDMSKRQAGLITPELKTGMDAAETANKQAVSKKKNRKRQMQKSRKKYREA